MVRRGNSVVARTTEEITEKLITVNRLLKNWQIALYLYSFSSDSPNSQPVE